MAVQQKMLELLKTESALILDGAEVEQIDGAGIQLLAVFMKEAGERNIAIRWSGVSDRLRLAADQLGLGGFLGLSLAD